MISSIKKYGGFYVGRYEMGKEMNYSKVGVEPITMADVWAGSWSKMYSKAKEYNKESTTAGMIWGSQFDAMINFCLSNSTESAKISENTNGNHSNNLFKTGMWMGENKQIDKINNIFDLEGNLKEYTKEVWSYTGQYDTLKQQRTKRTARGGNYIKVGGTRSICYRDEDVNITSNYYGTRISLYINE